MNNLRKLLCLLLACFALIAAAPARARAENYIKWVDCNVTEDALRRTLNYAVKYYNSQAVDFDFVRALAYLAVRNGNDFSPKTDAANLEKLVARLEGGEKLSEIVGDNKYYPYYVESYNAIFSGFVGEYRDAESGEVKFGLKAYFPLAKGYWFNHYDDFGNSRNYGYKRRHTGHDLMGGIGTPIVAVEGGTVQELGWNQYGGWRIGIRSFDTLRYYYYAHLRKDHPYLATLKRGDRVHAGQVVGYLGNTGYSSKENQNLKTGQPHLHFGMQLIFDESQVSGNHEIWIDVYAICRFLASNRATVKKDADTGEYYGIKLRESVE